MIGYFQFFLNIINFLTLIYFLILNSFYLVTSLFAFRALRKHVRRIKAFDVEDIITFAVAPPVTLIVPAHNEQATCVEATKSFLTLIYPEYEILIVNDGSSDETLARLIEAFELVSAVRMPTADISTKKVYQSYRSRRYRNLWVLDKENGGKADALNVGINFCRTPLFCAMDADSVLEREALMRIVRPFLEDARTVAAGGIIRIANGCTIREGVVSEVNLPRNILAKFQVLEYLRAFLSGRMGWSAMNATLIISGAFGLFKRSVVVDAGGFRTDTVGEDMELVVRLHRYCREKKIPYQIVYVPDPIAWTECPESWKILGRQRDRWQRGLSESLWRHRRMLGNARYGIIGLIAYPHFFFLEMLGPIIEFLGYISFIICLILGWISGVFIITFFMVAFMIGVALSVAAVCLEELSLRRYPKFKDLLKLFSIAVIENFGYRQLLTYWRFRGIISLIWHKKGWGGMERKGFNT